MSLTGPKNKGSWAILKFAISKKQLNNKLCCATFTTINGYVIW